MFWAPIIAAGITAAASAGSGIMANEARSDAASSAADQNWRQAAWQNDRNWEFQEDQQQFVMDEAQRQVERTEFLSGTAYQRSMRDMRAAGLNPMLAFQQGGATSSSSGNAGGGGMASSAMPPPVPVPQVEQVLGPAVSAAFQTANVLTQMERMEAETRVANATEHRTNAETSLRIAETARSGEAAALNRELVRTEIERQQQLRAQTGLAHAQTGTEGETQRYRAAQADRERQHQSREREFGVGRFGAEVGSGLGVVRGAGDAASSAIGNAFRGISEWLGGTSRPSNAQQVPSSRPRAPVLEIPLMP